MPQPTVLLDGLTLPEAPRWREGRLWFSDIYRGRVCSMTESGDDLRVEAETGGVPVGLGWLPDGRLLVVITNEQRMLRREHDGSLVLHADLSQHAVGFANDMTVTDDGTAFVGCFGFDLYAPEPVAAGPLLRVSAQGQVSVVGEPLHFANGATVVDGSTLVVAESFANRISAFDILEDGQLASRRDWACFGPLPTSTDLEQRFAEVVLAADGISCPDADGAIWVADFTSNLVSRVAAGGEVLEQVSTGERNCFAAALGGADGRTLFLCVAPDELDAAVHVSNPRGAVIAYRVAVAARS